MAPLKNIVLALAAMTPVFAQQLKPLTYVGCFSSSGSLTKGDTYQYQSSGHCQSVCVTANSASAVLGLTAGNECLCGSSTPPTSAKVDDTKCNSNCTGYGQDMCGGVNYYSVYLTNAGTTSSSSAETTTGSSDSATNTGTGTTTSEPQVVTSVSPGKTVVVTEAASAGQSTSASPTNASSGGSKPNTAAIAAGVVVGVLALGVIAGAAFFFVRQRRRRAAEEDYKRHQVSDFMAGSKPAIPAVRRSPSGPDSRYDGEAMAHRRLSDGSIADNEDYSRRILKVTNPDDRA